MTDAVPRPSVRAVVLYGSRFGNTERIARALARGLERTPEISVTCRSLDEVRPEEVHQCDFLAVGAPTEVFTAPKGMKEYLARVPVGDLRGKRGFAFDTRLAGPLSGSAGHYIEKHLERLGVRIVRPRASATVRGMTKEERSAHGDEGAPEWVHRLEGTPTSAAPPAASRLDLLVSGAEADFERIGVEIGTKLVPLASV